ncbi:MAG: DUF421 domain-containing protein [Nitrososphaerales archaeon]
MLELAGTMLPVVVHTAILYLFVVVFISLFVRRQTSEISALELVVVMLLGSAVETSLIAGNTSLQAGLVAALTLLVINRLMSLLQRRSRRLRRALRGGPVPLVYQGRFLAYGLQRAGLTQDDVRQGIRRRGYEQVEQVRLAMLEIDGSISVLPIRD